VHSNVILWAFDKPNPVKIFNGHTSFVYSVAALSNGEGAVSSGEDGTVRVWSRTYPYRYQDEMLMIPWTADGALAQTITHPTISVWVVDVLPNGDIVSGASDGMVRVWTRSEERKASAQEVQELDQAVASRQLNK
jgi:phospholipase A-2-activating protein